MISCKHPKRKYINSNGEGEISTWDLVDDTGAINLVAFNLDSYIMSNKLIEGQVIECLNVQVQVLRDYGITAGNTNGNSWTRRELHVAQDGAKIIPTSVICKWLKIKNIKVDWFNGSRTLVSMGNTRLSII
ncbi:unnamed protein product [Rotaria sp. Silwood1]|nr:unnamed protein product [Rotaria sp. Silwood1]CAF1654718.1 unnamed protein product [Rotaria sp. Silwood1]